MDIKLFGYSISLNVLILIGILYLIMIVNALSSSCNMEGMKLNKGTKKSVEAEAVAVAQAMDALKQKQELESANLAYQLALSRSAYNT